MRGAMRLCPVLALASLAVSGGGASLRAQEPTPAPAPPEVGAPAPDFAIPAASRYGLLRQLARISDHRGQTVVLAFVVQARTRG